MFQDDGSSSVTSSPLQYFYMPSNGSQQYPWIRELKSEERGLYLIHLLLTCAKHVASGSFENAEIALAQISHLASADGDTIQRIAAYFTEALALRILKSWPGLHRALNATKLNLVSDLISVRKLFFDMFPFLKVAFLLTNQAIIEAMEGEKMVHIIDLNAADPTRWLVLLQALNARPEGPPHLRISGIHQQKMILDQVGQTLVQEAERLDIPFQFNPIVSKLENLDVEKLKVKTGEALAISSVLHLHSFLASDDELKKKNPNLQLQNTLGDLLEKESLSLDSTTTSTSPHSCSYSTAMDRFLNALWSLSPKLMVVMEQDSNHNGSTLMERLSEALYSYAALFDCLESSVPRTSEDRLKVEKMLLGEEIQNIIACEGAERKERHEKLEKWIQRLDLSGFGMVGLSYYGLMQARRLLQEHGFDGYKIKEQNGCAVICWQERPLFSVSAWKCRK